MNGGPTDGSTGIGAAIRSGTVDGRAVVVVDVDGRRHAVDRWCPHQQADLAEGTMVAGALRCPLHGFLFTLHDGRGLNNRLCVEVHDADAVVPD